tara:strand:- start:172 stop:564 length:393 start_codon:yes stop_codon:yes gene_type:complete
MLNTKSVQTPMFHRIGSRNVTHYSGKHVNNSKLQGNTHKTTETMHSETVHSKTVHSETVHSKTVHSETVHSMHNSRNSQKRKRHKYEDDVNNFSDDSGESICESSEEEEEDSLSDMDDFIVNDEKEFDEQ